MQGIATILAHKCCRALGCCLYEMCSRRKLFSARHSQKFSVESEEITLPQFPEQFSAELAEVWHRWVEIFSDCTAEVKRCQCKVPGTTGQWGYALVVCS